MQFTELIIKEIYLTKRNEKRENVINLFPYDDNANAAQVSHQGCMLVVQMPHKIRKTLTKKYLNQNRFSAHDGCPNVVQ